MTRTVTEGGCARSLFYFAYGSNMNPLQMDERLPNARRVGVGYVDGWTVRERLYANMERMRGGRTHGVVYLLTETEVNLMDRYEGYPRTYTAMTMTVNVRIGSGAFGYTPIPCMVYVMTPGTLAYRHSLPYPEAYRKRCSLGARINRIPDAFAEDGGDNLLKIADGFAVAG